MEPMDDYTSDMDIERNINEAEPEEQLSDREIDEILGVEYENIDSEELDSEITPNNKSVKWKKKSPDKGKAKKPQAPRQQEYVYMQEPSIEEAAADTYSEAYIEEHVTEAEQTLIAEEQTPIEVEQYSHDLSDNISTEGFVPEHQREFSGNEYENIQEHSIVDSSVSSPYAEQAEGQAFIPVAEEQMQENVPKTTNNLADNISIAEEANIPPTNNFPAEAQMERFGPEEIPRYIAENNYTSFDEWSRPEGGVDSANNIPIPKPQIVEPLAGYNTNTIDEYGYSVAGAVLPVTELPYNSREDVQVVNYDYADEFYGTAKVNNAELHEDIAQVHATETPAAEQKRSQTQVVISEGIIPYNEKAGREKEKENQKEPVGTDISKVSTEDSVNNPLVQETKDKQPELLEDQRDIQQEERATDKSNIRHFNTSAMIPRSFEHLTGLTVNFIMNSSSDPNSATDEGVQKIREYSNTEILDSAAAHGLIKSMAYHFKDLTAGAEAANKLICEGKLTLNDLSSKDNLKTALAEKDVKLGFNITRNRKEIYDLLSTQAELQSFISMHENAFSKDTKEFVESGKFLDLKKVGKMRKVAAEYFNASDNTMLRSLDFGRMSKKDIAKILKNAEKYKLSSSDIKILKLLKKSKDFQVARSAFRGRFTLIRKCIRSLSQGDDAFAQGLRNIKSLAKVGGVAFKAIRVEAVGIKKLASLALKASGLDAVIVKKKQDIKNAASLAKQKTVSKVKQSKAGQKVAEKNKAVRKRFEKATNKVTATKPYQFTKKAASKAGKAAKKTGKVAGTAFRVVTSPARGIAKIFNILKTVKRTIALIVGVPLAIIMLIYMIFFMVGGAFQISTPGVESVLNETIYFIVDISTKVVNTRKMQDNVDLLVELDAELYEKAVEIGESRPEPPYDEVLCDHYIDHYGSPDKEVGYTIHYLDAYGNEIANHSSNIKDLISMAAVMFGNADTIDQHPEAFQELLKDLYELSHPEIEWEATDIYTCMEGCEDFDYCCDNAGDYDTYEYYMSEGCGRYGEMEPYNSEGCEEEESEEEDSYLDSEYTDPEGLEEEPERFCPGHSVPICFGHRDVDIFITVYDIYYLTENNIYPEDWHTKSYGPYIREFTKQKRWQDVEQTAWAIRLYDQDWYDFYGVNLEDGVMFVGENAVLDEARIAELMELYGGDMNQVQQALISYAMNSVGKIKYYWGGKMTTVGYEGNNFGDIIKADYKGRNVKGLDCSGFVQWAYKSALGIDLPAGTAGYTGYQQKSYSELKIGDLGFQNNPGAATNHVGIYAGRDANGNDLWIHCSSGGGGVVVNDTNVFKKYVSILE